MRVFREGQAVKLYPLFTKYVETVKANDLKPYDYIRYLLEELPEHMEDVDRSFIEDILPWAEKLLAEI